MAFQRSPEIQKFPQCSLLAAISKHDIFINIETDGKRERNSQQRHIKYNKCVITLEILICTKNASSDYIYRARDEDLILYFGNVRSRGKSVNLSLPLHTIGRIICPGYSDHNFSYTENLTQKRISYTTTFSPPKHTGAHNTSSSGTIQSKAALSQLLTMEG